MPINLRAILTVAVPTVTTLFGLLWLFVSRKPRSPRPKIKDREEEKNPTSTKSHVNEKGDEASKHEALNKAGGNVSSLNSGSGDPLENLILFQTERKSSPQIICGEIEPVQHTQTQLTAVSHCSIEEQIVPQVTDTVPECNPVSTSTLQQESVENGLHDTEEVEIREKIVSVQTAQVHSSPLPSSHTTADSNENASYVEPENDQKEIVFSAQPSTGGETDRNISENNAVSTSPLDSNTNNNSAPLFTDNMEPSVGLRISWSDEVANCDCSTQNGLESPSVSNGGDNNGQCSESAVTACDKKLNSVSPDPSSPDGSGDSATVKGLHSYHERNGESLNSSDSSSNCDNTSEASNDSGKGASVSETASQQSLDEERVFEFNMPSEMCGLFIGSRGKTVKSIRDMSNTRIKLKNNPYTLEFQICVIEGKQSAIENALNIIRKKFPSVKYPGMDLLPLAPTVSNTNPVLVPEIMQLSLPEGVSLDVVVSSIVDAGRIFVQQPTHPTYPSLERLNQCMNSCYMQEGGVPDIPRPIENGVICAAPMLNGWYRAQIMAIHEETQECDIKYVDYGGYSRVSSTLLKQIRSDFMTLPFEAVECYLANITPLQSETYFSPEAAAVLEQLTQGKLLQAQVVGRSDDGIPYIHIYQISGSMSSALMVNRELVNQGVARWIEVIS